MVLAHLGQEGVEVPVALVERRARSGLKLTGCVNGRRNLGGKVLVLQRQRTIGDKIGASRREGTAAQRSTESAPEHAERGKPDAAYIGK